MEQENMKNSMENGEEGRQKTEDLEKQETDRDMSAENSQDKADQIKVKEENAKEQPDTEDQADAKEQPDTEDEADVSWQPDTKDQKGANPLSDDRARAGGGETGGDKAQKETAEKPEKRTGNKKKHLISAGILFVLIAVCCCAYSAIAFSYKDKFLPGTWINGIDCAELDGAQVAGMLENQLQTYRLDVTGRDYTSGAPETLLGQVTAEDISLTYSINSRKAVDDLLAEQNIFTWLYRRWSDDTYSFQLSQGVAYDEEQLNSIVNGWEACRSDHMTAPQDAYISGYSDKLKGYEIIPEVEGTKFDVGTLMELIDVAILSQETSLDLEAEGCYAEPAVRQDAAQLTEPVEAVNKWLGTKITYDWNGAEVVVDAELLKDWITLEQNGPVLDEKAVAAFVKEQAEENDTYGKRRHFMTTLGVELSLPSGYYGWLTDKEMETAELIEAIHQGQTVSREPVYASTARQKGTSDIGSSYVEVDLTHQHLYLYENGTIIFETDFVSGSMSSTPDCVTPEGVFGISYKTTNAVLRGANYETPVNYWMPFYGNYGLHDATWRSEFGGQIYITNGSHGCVNLPLSSAATIYEHMSTGFPVICYYYQVDPIADQQPPDEWNNDDDEDEE